MVLNLRRRCDCPASTWGFVVAMRIRQWTPSGRIARVAIMLDNGAAKDSIPALWGHRRGPLRLLLARPDHASREKQAARWPATPGTHNMSRPMTGKTAHIWKSQR